MFYFCFSRSYLIIEGVKEIATDSKCMGMLILYSIDMLFVAQQGDI